MTTPKTGEPSKAAFLDRDGVIVRDTHYVHKIEDFAFMPGAVEGLRMLRELEYKLIVVTNQSGIGRNYFSEKDYHIFSHHMVDQLAAHEIGLDGIYFCPHPPTSALEACDCRKPAPGMLITAAQALNIAIGQSIMIGDKQSDMQAGRAAGIDKCFLMTDNDNPRKLTDVHDNSFSSLIAVAQFLTSHAA